MSKPRKGLAGTMDTPTTASDLLRRARELVKRGDAASLRAAAETAWMAAVAAGDIAGRLSGRQKEVRHDGRIANLVRAADRAGEFADPIVGRFTALKDFHAECAYQGACNRREVRAGIALASSLVQDVRRMEQALARRGEQVPPPFASKRSREWRKKAGLP